MHNCQVRVPGATPHDRGPLCERVTEGRTGERGLPHYVFDDPKNGHARKIHNRIETHR